MEKPMSVYQADLIELGAEYLHYHVMGWMFAHGEDVSDDVKEFLEFCKQEDHESLHCKRGGDGKSFYERREEAKAQELRE